MFDSLRALTDHEILSRTHALSVEERTLTLSLLLHLNEIERRKLHLKHGHSSMFAYCTASLGYSESAANRRIRTARCVARFPEVFALLQTGKVSLSTISQVSKILKPDNGSAVLARIAGKSQREVAAIIAEYEPLAAFPPDRVRTVVIPVREANESAPALEAPEIHRRSGGQKLASVSGPPQAAILRACDESPTLAATMSVKLERRALVQFSASEAFISKLEKARSLAAHRLRGNTSIEQVLDLLLDEFIWREDPTARAQRRERRNETANKPKSPAATSPRAVPARVRDQIFARDHQQCTYVGSTGTRCRSTYALQVDHIRPVARGGPGTPDNLRLLCAQHNRLESERLLGPSRPPEP